MKMNKTEIVDVLIAADPQVVRNTARALRTRPRRGVRLTKAELVKATKAVQLLMKKIFTKAELELVLGVLTSGEDATIVEFVGIDIEAKAKQYQAALLELRASA